MDGDAIGLAWLQVSVRVAVLLGTAGLAALIMVRSSAAARHRVLALAVAASLALPLLAWALQGLAPAHEWGLADAPAQRVLDAIVIGAGEPESSDVVGGPGWSRWLALAWAVGTVLVSLRLVRGYEAARTLARATSPGACSAWDEALADAAATLDLRDAVVLRRSDVVRSPMTIGLLRPQIVLPAEAERWSHERLRAVLIHELGHVRRRDALTQLGAQIVCALHWPNPLAWLVAARLRVEREYACDDLVLAAGIRASSYADDLLDVVRGCASHRSARIGVMAVADRCDAEARLRRVLDQDTPRRPLGPWFRGLATLATVAAVLVLARTAGSAPDSVERVGAEPAATSARARLTLGEAELTDLPDDQPFAFYVSDAEPIELEPIRAALMENYATLQRCYAQRLAAVPGLTGKIGIHWTIAPDGKVTEQCITTNTVGDPDLTECVNELIRTTQFPSSPTGPVSVSLPFEFEGD